MKPITTRDFSRREFLVFSAAASGGLVLAACGATALAPAASATPVPRIENALNIYNWSQYLNPDTLTQFQKLQAGMAIKQDTYASNEDMLAKIEAGAKGYDIVVPTGYMVKIMIDKKLLLPIDHMLLTNYSHIDKRFTLSGYDFGNKYSVHDILERLFRNGAEVQRQDFGAGRGQRGHRLNPQVPGLLL